MKHFVIGYFVVYKFAINCTSIKRKLFEIVKLCKGNLTLRLHGDWRLETNSMSVSHGQATKFRVTGIPAGSDSTGILP